MVNTDCVKVRVLNQVSDQVRDQVNYPEANHVLSDVWHQVRDQVWIQVRFKVWIRVLWLIQIV
jgi:hypothetical protein